MKTYFSIILVIAAISAAAADVVTQKLQQGLFEEEANHDLKAAIQAYEAVVLHGDEQRKILATAIFRLGECYRKLGETNEAQAYYSRIIRDFSDQRQLVELSRKHGADAAPATGDSEVVRELERRHARLLGEFVEANARAERVKNMPMDELALGARQFFDDAELQSLQNNLNTAQQESAALRGRGIGEEHPDMRALAARMKLIQTQFADRLKRLVENEVAATQLLRNQVSDLEQELARPRDQRVTGPAAMSSRAVTLLKEELALAEQQVSSAETSFSAGRSTSDEVLNAKKEVLRLKRLLPENSKTSQQEQLLRQQIDIVRQVLRQVEDRAKAGATSSGTPGEFALKRELLSLERELAGIRSATADIGAKPTSPHTTTAEAEELARVKTLALNSPDLLQTAARDGLSELQDAARGGHYSVVEFILSQKVDPNGPENSAPPIVLAAGRGHLRIVELLLASGANVDAPQKAGAPPYFGGETALILASAGGFRSVVELLLERNANVNHRTHVGATALHYATLNGRAAIVELLLRNGAATAIVATPPKSSTVLWPGSASSGATPLHIAAEKGFSAITEMLVKAGAPVNATDSAGITPLHLGVLDEAVASVLLRNGADPNVEARDGSTAFSKSLRGKAEVVALVLSHGGKLDQPLNLLGYSWAPLYPLHLAVGRPVEVLLAVLAAKPDLSVTNRFGASPLWLAIETKSPPGNVAALLAAGADPNQQGQYPPILRACEVANTEAVHALLKHGANPNVIGPTGKTPLSTVQDALKSGGAADRSYADVQTIERLLREHGASDHLSRLMAIDYTRPTWSGAPKKVFYRCTNDYNHFTLFEFLARVFTAEQVPFPDLAHVTIERIDGTNAKPREIAVNVEALLASNDCGKDMLLNWGDRLSIPEIDHPLNAKWEGLPGKYFSILGRCLAREVKLVVKDQTNTLVLLEELPPDPANSLIKSLPGLAEGKGKYVIALRLKEVVYNSNLLRASSDLTRVRVTRRDTKTATTNRWEIDLTKVQTSLEARQPAAAGVKNLPKLWFEHDLWLRDGDVVEIPDR